MLQHSPGVRDYKPTKPEGGRKAFPNRTARGPLKGKRGKKTNNKTTAHLGGGKNECWAGEGGVKEEHNQKKNVVKRNG